MPCRVEWQSWSMVGPGVQIAELPGPRLWLQLPEAVVHEKKSLLGDCCHSQSYCRQLIVIFWFCWVQELAVQ